MKPHRERTATSLAACLAALSSINCHGSTREPDRPEPVAVPPPPSGAPDAQPQSPPRAAGDAKQGGQSGAPSSLGAALNGCRTASNGEHCYYAGKLLAKISGLIWRCQKGNVKACRHVPPAFAKYPSEQLDESALDLFERGCRANHGDSCTEVGTNHAIQERSALAEQHFEKACGLGSALGCKFRGTTTPAR
jgi:hypothetical protein